MIYGELVAEDVQGGRPSHPHGHMEKWNNSFPFFLFFIPDYGAFIYI